MTPAFHNVSFLDWDTKLFGFSVAQIQPPELNDTDLETALLAARSCEARLVYWFTDAEYAVPDRIIQRYGGSLVDQRVTFRATLNRHHRRNVSTGGRTFSIREFPKGAPNIDLLTLGLLAGAQSRFRVDPHVPRVAFEDLYHCWVERSTRREIADMVFVAEGNNAEVVGLLTVARRNRTGIIGLISVAPKARGGGLGQRLINTAHQWMLDAGIDEAMVVTQVDNRAACALYEKAGYDQVSVENVFHFWLGTNVGAT